MTVSDDDLVQMYRYMVLCRAFEEKMCSIGRTWHSSIGNEGTIVGTFFKLSKDDVISPHYRTNASALLVRGVPPKQLMASLLGRKADFGMKLWAELRVLPRVAGVEGSIIPISAGAALASKLKKTGQVVVIGTGDGSICLGDFHEGLNLAAVLKVPLVITIVNNLVYMHVPMEKYTLIKDIADWAASYGVPTVSIDGNDVLAVHKAVQEAVKKAREGEGPVLIDCKTYRVTGHTVPDPIDPNLYWARWREEIEKWNEMDPIKRLKGVLLEKGSLTERGVTEIYEQARREIEEAYNFAKNLPPLGKEEVSKMEKFVFV